MLAAIGAFLGSFIAALFGDKFNPTIFKLGIAVYAIYVLIFPLSYNMIHQWQYYQALINDFERRRRNFEGQLYPKKVHDIIGTQIEDSQKRFNDWFRWTIYAYLGVIIMAIIAFLLADVFESTIHSPIINSTNNSSAV